MDIEIFAEGLQFPEGPIVFPDGSVVLVEIQRKTLTRVWKGRSEVIAHLGGGPNGAALGPDGAVYVCNNGGMEFHDAGGLNIPGGAPPDYETGRIERVDLATGKFERIYEKINGERLSGPNDIVFDKSGAFWFTDLGKLRPRASEFGGLYYAKPDGSKLTEIVYGHLNFNGVGLSPDEKTVYAADTETAKLWANDIVGEGEVAPRLPGFAGRLVAKQTSHCYFDSLAVAASGNVCVATIINGGITTITPDGVSSHIPMPDPIVTNIAFGGADMRDAYITLSGTGKLAKVRWPEPGLKLNWPARAPAVHEERAMIIVHHLNESRSQRVLWLLEELGLAYEIKNYTRDATTRLAPPELKAIHPLGKSPVVEENGQVFAESGAIVEYFAERYGDGKLSVSPSEPARAAYLHWLHFAEGSGMLPLLLKLYVGLLGEAGAPLMAMRIEPEIANHLAYADGAIGGGDYFVANRFTAADIQMGFVLDAANNRGGLERYPNLVRVRAANQARPAYQRALERGGRYKMGD